VNGNYTLNSYLKLRQKLFWEIVGGGGFSYTQADYKNIVNSVPNQTDQQTYGHQRGGLNKQKTRNTKWVSAARPIYGQQISVSIRSAPITGPSSISPNADNFFSRPISIHTEAAILLRQKHQFLTAN